MSRRTTKCHFRAQLSSPSQSQTSLYKISTRSFPLVLSRISPRFQGLGDCLATHLSTRMDRAWAWSLLGFFPLFDFGSGTIGLVILVIDSMITMDISHKFFAIVSEFSDKCRIVYIKTIESNQLAPDFIFPCGTDHIKRMFMLGLEYYLIFRNFGFLEAHLPGASPKWNLIENIAENRIPFPQLSPPFVPYSSYPLGTILSSIENAFSDKLAVCLWKNTWYILWKDKSWRVRPANKWSLTWEFFLDGDLFFWVAVMGIRTALESIFDVSIYSILWWNINFFDSQSRANATVQFPGRNSNILAHPGNEYLDQPRASWMQA